MGKESNVYDVIIIGAGPGGSFAAKAAAEKGYKTLLIDKEQISKEGRYKACGGAMAWELVEEIDYPEDKIARVIESLELHHVDGEDFSKKGKTHQKLNFIWLNDTAIHKMILQFVFITRL